MHFWDVCVHASERQRNRLTVQLAVLSCQGPPSLARLHADTPQPELLKRSPVPAGYTHLQILAHLKIKWWNITNTPRPAHIPAFLPNLPTPTEGLT